MFGMRPPPIARPGRFRSRLMITLCGLILLAGCARSGRPRATLRYPIIQEPGTLDPARIQDLYTSELLQNVYEGLVTIDSSNLVTPALAEKWEINSDGTVYTFHLRTAHFHNGRPVTASDFVYSLTRALRKETLSPTALTYLNDVVGARDVAGGKTSSLAGARAIDARTLQVTIDRRRPYFLAKLTYPTAWVVCPEAVQRNGGRVEEAAAIGTGPFRLSEYRRGAKVTLEANREYWNGPPALDRIERPIILDPQTYHARYENDELDATGAAVTDFIQDQKDPAMKGQCFALPQANLFYIVMHPGLQPAFADRRVRKAFAMAIDRNEISRVAYHGVCPPAYGFLPPGIPGSNPNIRRIPYDPDSARRLLAQAGYPGGRGFPVLTLVTLEHQPEWAANVNLIRDFLKKNLGISVNLREYEAVQFWHDTSDEEKIPFYITGWIADYLDPQDFLSLLLSSGSSMNHVRYRNPRLDALCAEADSEPDPARRVALYRQADQIAMDDVAVLPMVNYRQPFLIKPRVVDYSNNLLSFFLPHRRTRIRSD